MVLILELFFALVRSVLRPLARLFFALAVVSRIRGSRVVLRELHEFVELSFENSFFETRLQVMLMVLSLCPSCCWWTCLCSRCLRSSTRCPPRFKSWFGDAVESWVRAPKNSRASRASFCSFAPLRAPPKNVALALVARACSVFEGLLRALRLVLVERIYMFVLRLARLPAKPFLRALRLMRLMTT